MPRSLLLLVLIVAAPVSAQKTPEQRAAEATIAAQVAAAVAAERRGDLAKLKEAVGVALKAAGQEYELRRFLAGQLIDGRLYALGEQACRQVRATMPDDGALAGMHGIALKGLKRHDEALQAFDFALERLPDHAGLIAHRAQTHLYLSHMDVAEKEIRRAVALAPKDPLVLGVQAEIQFRTQDYPACEATCRTLLDATPRDLRGITLLIRVRRALGRPDEAVQTADQALNLLPDDPEILLYRGEALLAAGRATDAVADLEKVAARSPKDHRPYMALAKAYLKLGRRDDAALAQKKFHELKPKGF